MLSTGSGGRGRSEALQMLISHRNVDAREGASRVHPSYQRSLKNQEVFLGLRPKRRVGARCGKVGFFLDSFFLIIVQKCSRFPFLDQWLAILAIGQRLQGSLASRSIMPFRFRLLGDHVTILTSYPFPSFSQFV